MEIIVKNKKPTLTDLALWMNECPFPHKQLIFDADDEQICLFIGYPDENYEVVKAEVEYEVMRGQGEEVN